MHNQHNQFLTKPPVSSRYISVFLNSGEVDPYKTALKNSTAITDQKLKPRFNRAEFSFSKIMICKLITLAIFCSTNLMQNNRTKFNSVEANETGNHSCDLYEVCMIAGAFLSHLAVCLAVWCSFCSTVLKCWPLFLNARVLLITSRLCFTSVKLKTPIQNIASRENKSLTTTGGERRWFHSMTGSTFLRLQVYERAGISLVELYETVWKSVISVGKKSYKG